MQIEELATALSKVGGLPIAELLTTMQAMSDKIEAINDEIWNRETACQKLGIGKNLLTEWERQGLPACHKGGRIFYVKSDIIKWLRSDSGNIAEAAEAVINKLKHKRA